MKASLAVIRDISMQQTCLGLALLVYSHFIIGIMRCRWRLLLEGDLCRILFFCREGSRFLQVIGGGLEDRRWIRITMFNCEILWLLADIKSLLEHCQEHQGLDVEELLDSFLRIANFRPLYKTSIIKIRFLMIWYFPLILHQI